MSDIPPGWREILLAVITATNTILLAWLHQRTTAQHRAIRKQVEVGQNGYQNGHSDP